MEDQLGDGNRLEDRSGSIIDRDFILIPFFPKKTFLDILRPGRDLTFNVPFNVSW